ncbi:FHIPEP family type III secretion protein [Escherichia coli]
MLIRGVGWRLTLVSAAGTLPGEATVDPAFGLNAIWIESALKEQAQIQGYTVVEASTVEATHLNHLIRPACRRAVWSSGGATVAGSRRPGRCQS